MGVIVNGELARRLGRHAHCADTAAAPTGFSLLVERCAEELGCPVAGYATRGTAEEQAEGISRLDIPRGGRALVWVDGPAARTFDDEEDFLELVLQGVVTGFLEGAAGGILMLEEGANNHYEYGRFTLGDLASERALELHPGLARLLDPAATRGDLAGDEEVEEALGHLVGMLRYSFYDEPGVAQTFPADFIAAECRGWRLTMHYRDMPNEFTVEQAPPNDGISDMAKKNRSNRIRFSIAREATPTTYKHGDYYLDPAIEDAYHSVSELPQPRIW